MRRITAAAAQPYDLILRHGMIYDGRGGAPFLGDVAIRGDLSGRDRMAEIRRGG